MSLAHEFYAEMQLANGTWKAMCMHAGYINDLSAKAGVDWPEIHRGFPKDVSQEIYTGLMHWGNEFWVDYDDYVAHVHKYAPRGTAQALETMLFEPIEKLKPSSDTRVRLIIVSG